MKKLISIILIFLSLNSYSYKSDYGVFDDLVSPVTTPAKYITAGGLAVAGMVYLNKDFRTYRKRESFEDAQFLGKYGVVGDLLGWGFLNVIYTLSAYGYGSYTGNQEAIQASEHMAKASLYASGVTMVLKKSVSERRPGYPDDPDSFPSGHSSGSFSFASVVAARHGWYWGGAAYATATFISLSRINDDYHYLHDVVFGMTIGAAYGWGTYYNYKSGKPYLLSIIPLPEGAGLSFITEF